MAKYKLKITARHFDEDGHLSYRMNELSITEETAESLRKDHSVRPIQLIGGGDQNMDINVEIWKDEEVIGGWAYM